MPRFVRFVIKLIAALAASLVGVGVLFVGFYELHDFWPYLPAMKSIYESMAPEDKEPPQNVQDFVGKAEGNVVDHFVARRLLYETKGPERMLLWHYHSSMWGLLLPFHFTKKERIAFYCHYLPYEKGNGFGAASQYYFGRSPDKLSVDELATIVAIGRSPRGNSPSQHPERLQTAKQRLLETYAGAR